MQGRIGYSRWRYVIGPWPFAPLPIAVFGTLAFAARGVVIAGASSDSAVDVAVTVLRHAALGAAVLAAFSTVLVVVGGWRPGEPVVPTRARYVATCLLAALVGTTGLLLMRLVNQDAYTGQGVYQSLPIAFAVSFAIIVLITFALSNGFGYSRYRIWENLDRLRDQVDQLGRQRTLIVEADERVRGEVAAALHDEVQAVLLRANLRLSALAEDAAPAEAAAIRAVVADLERLRGAGVRSVGRRIAPPIETIGLVAALDDLAASYAGSIEVALEIAPDLDAGDRAAAVYRIVEQALLNAAAHGRATQVAVEVRSEDSAMRVIVDDDGLGLAEDRMPGTGTAIIDAWVGTHDGTWSLSGRPGGGTRLVASVPA